MKKKRNFLTIISSILGVFTLTSLFCCSIFFRSDKKSEGVKADESILLADLRIDDFVEYNIDCYVDNLNSHFGYTWEDDDIDYDYGEFGSVYMTGNLYISYFRFIDTTGEHYKLRVYVNEHFGYDSLYFENVVQDGYIQFYSDYNFSLSLYNRYYLIYDCNLSRSLSGQLSFDLGYNWVEFKDGVFTQNFSLNSLVDSLGLINPDDVYNYPLKFLPNAYDLNDEIVTNLLDDKGHSLYEVSRYFVTDPDFDESDSLHFEMNLPTETPYDEGYNSGYLTGYSDGLAQGYNNGFNEGYNAGFNSGFDSGQADLENKIQNSYNEGYSVGYNEGFNTDSTAMTIISGIFQVALVPINFFLGIFNFEILGVNLTSLIQAIFTIVLTIIIFKSVFGGKSD